MPGGGYGSPIEKIESDKLRYLYDLNVFGPLFAMQAVIPVMRAQGGGAIVNISSGTSNMYIPNVGAYSSTKRALNGLSLTARAELANDRILVSVVYPYITDSDFYRNTLTAEGGAPGHLQIHRDMPPADTNEYVAEKILEAIESGAAEIYAHDWMKNRQAR
jgi:short-subunit dehydrogenase